MNKTDTTLTNGVNLAHQATMRALQIMQDKQDRVLLRRLLLLKHELIAIDQAKKAASLKLRVLIVETIKSYQDAIADDRHAVHHSTRLMIPKHLIQDTITILEHQLQVLDLRIV